MLTKKGFLYQSDFDWLGAFVEHFATKFIDFVQTFRYCKKVIACQLTVLAGETAATVGHDDFHFADATGIEKHLALGRVGCVVFVVQTGSGVTVWNPDSFAAPADMDELAL